MEKIKLGKSGLLVPPIALGCMRLADAERTQADKFLHTALELELNFFDHADIYGGGACECVFGEMIKDAGVRREDLIIQSKCAIVPGKMYDFSKEHILSAVDGSLKRLGTDYLDVLLLHRPDALMEPEEVAEAFDELEKSGKADKLRELADSEDCRALGAMLDAAAVAKAVAKGDGEAINGILRQVLSTEEGRRVAQKINEAMK